MSSYRDEREAALVQADALRQQNQSLGTENNALRHELDGLRRENDQLRVAAGVAPRRRTNPLVFVLLAAGIVVMAGAGATMWLVMGRGDVPPPEPPPQMPYPQPPSLPPQYAPPAT